ncbi:hypothetical protein [Yoonia algicola]|uniref:Ferrochelatase n=1 Tax=Yoonia algicola TaxID=3137368 RepID=A0AAN0LZK4_9RHOB
MFKNLTAFAAATALCASTAFAGGLSPEIIESAPAEPAPAAASSINPTFIVLGVVALLLIASAGGDDDGEEEPILEKEPQQPS